MDRGERLRRGIDLFNRGLYWEAHEAWEEAWTPDRRGPESGFWKGLIQVAAGCLHCIRRNRRGAVNKLRGGTGYLAEFLPSHRGVDTARLVEEAGWFLAEIEGGRWPEVALPQIRMVQE